MAAREFVQDDRAIRPTILAVVLGIHLAVLFIPLADDVERARDLASRGSLVLIRSRPEVPPLLSREPTVELSTVNVDAPSRPNLAPFSLPSDTAPIGSAMAPPDWKQSGADAAADAVRDNYRALGPPPEEPKVKLPPPPFRPPPRHKFGDSDEDALRNPIMWLSEHCWLRPRNYQAQPGDPFASVPMTFCSFPFGKKEPRGDLFEHLRKTPPVP